ncbi:MAG: hypothetical protein Q4D55_11605 [Eubacteriales bacterium]|nr:hypothetical protein [Eubacteriales bacterium]
MAIKIWRGKRLVLKEMGRCGTKNVISVDIFEVLKEVMEIFRDKARMFVRNYMDREGDPHFCRDYYDQRVWYFSWVSSFADVLGKRERNGGNCRIL